MGFGLIKKNLILILFFRVIKGTVALPLMYALSNRHKKTVRRDRLFNFLKYGQLVRCVVMCTARVKPELVLLGKMSILLAF